MIEIARVEKAPKIVKTIVVVDPSVRAKDLEAVIVAGRGEDENIYVLADRSAYRVSGSAEGSALRTARIADEVSADNIFFETFPHAHLYQSTFRSVDCRIPVTELRQVPTYQRVRDLIGAYEFGCVKHVGCWPGLEEDFRRLHAEARHLPDRLIAMSNVVTLLRTRFTPEIRR